MKTTVKTISTIIALLCANAAHAASTAEMNAAFDQFQHGVGMWSNASSPANMQNDGVKEAASGLKRMGFNYTDDQVRSAMQQYGTAANYDVFVKQLNAQTSQSVPTVPTAPNTGVVDLAVYSHDKTRQLSVDTDQDKSIADNTSHTDAVGAALNTHLNATNQHLNTVDKNVQALTDDTNDRFADTARHISNNAHDIAANKAAEDKAIQDAVKHTDAVGTALNTHINATNQHLNTVDKNVQALTNDTNDRFADTARHISNNAQDIAANKAADDKAIKDAVKHTDAVGTALNSHLNATNQHLNTVDKNVQALTDDTNDRFADTAQHISDNAKEIADNQAKQVKKDTQQDNAVAEAKAVAEVAEGVAHRLDNAANPRYQSMIAARQAATEENALKTNASQGSRTMTNNASGTVDNKTQQQVTNNTFAIIGVRNEQVVQGEHVQKMDQVVSHNSMAIQSNAARIDNNSQRIDKNARDIDDTRDDLKRGLNNAAAMSSLHYHSDNSWALSTGTANGDGAAIAAGVQKGLTSHVAVNMQASSSFDNGWMAGAGISGDF